MIFKLLHNEFDVDTSLLHHSTYTTTRGHNFKPQKSFSSVLRNCFSVRVINNWNKLPYNVINFNIVNQDIR